LVIKIGEGINSGFISNDFILSNNNSKEQKQIVSLVELYSNIMC